jgi:hypothetical protein
MDDYSPFWQIFGSLLALAVFWIPLRKPDLFVRTVAIIGLGAFGLLALSPATGVSAYAPFWLYNGLYYVVLACLALAHSGWPTD